MYGMRISTWALIKELFQFKLGRVRNSLLEEAKKSIRAAY